MDSFAAVVIALMAAYTVGIVVGWLAARERDAMGPVGDTQQRYRGASRDHPWGIPSHSVPRSTCKHPECAQIRAARDCRVTRPDEIKTFAPDPPSQPRPERPAPPVTPARPPGL